MKQFDENNVNIYTYKISKAIKLILFIFLLSLIVLLKTEVYASSDEISIYGKDNFGEEYSNAYIRDRSSADVIRTSSGISVKSGIQINSPSGDNSKYYTSNNTSKSEYVDYSKAARYINENGESTWLDMRLYIWTNNQNYPWALSTDYILIMNFHTSIIQYTRVEFHFYTEGHCGDSSYEQPFQGVLRIADLDPKEGILIWSGYNKFYVKEGIPIISVLAGENNITNSNNPFGTSGTAEHSYFFGTRDNNLTDNVWVEINSTLSEPFSVIFGTRNVNRGSYMYYTGTPIEYYVDGELKDTSYCVPYGKYKLINPRKMDSEKEGYTVDGWYTDETYSIKAQSGIAGESTIKLYGRTILDKKYTITVDNEREGHTYNSYQVFQGDYYEREDENGNKIPTLSNIEWGEELQKEVEEGKKHGDKIIIKRKKSRFIWRL